MYEKWGEVKEGDLKDGGGAGGSMVRGYDNIFAVNVFWHEVSLWRAMMMI